MSTKLSAGLLLYRRALDGIEVMLVHPGGPYWANKDEHGWSVPKGETEPNEDPLKGALREFHEELGRPAPSGETIELGEFRQTNKTVAIWALEGDFDASHIQSNTFEMIWPPGSGKTAVFPEVDKAQWWPVDVARSKLHKGQVGVIDALLVAIDSDE